MAIALAAINNILRILWGHIPSTLRRKTNSKAAEKIGNWAKALRDTLKNSKAGSLHKLPLTLPKPWSDLTVAKTIQETDAIKMNPRVRDAPTEAIYFRTLEA
jgi:hypothetical protein